MRKKVSYVYPNTSDLNRRGRGGLSARVELARSSGCEFIEMPADFIKNKTEIELTGLDLGCALTKEAIVALYESDSPSRELAYILHTEPSLPRTDGYGLTQQAVLRWYTPEWVSRLTEMLPFVAHHLSLSPALIEIHPGDTRNSVDDIINAIRFIQDTFHSEFATRPLILLENRTEQFLSTGHELARFTTRIAQEDDLKSTVGIVLDIQQLFSRTRSSFLDELRAIPTGSVKGLHIHSNTEHLQNLIQSRGGMSSLG